MQDTHSGPNAPQQNTVNSIASKSTPITGDDFSYDPDSKTLTVTSSNGTTNWRRSGDFRTIRSDATKLIVGEDVTDIGYNAFDDCASLKEVSFAGSKLETIQQWSFNGCSALEDLVLPERLKSIGKRAFNYCTSLKSVAMPKSLNSIGEGAFIRCNKLGTITVAAENTTFTAVDNVLITPTRQN